MALKIVIVGENSCAYKFLLKYGDKVEQVFGVVVANVVHLVWGYGQTIVASAALGRVLHDAHHTLHNVVYIGKVALAVAVVEYFNGLAFYQFVGKTKVSHVGTACRAIDGKETQARGRNVVKFAVGMRHQLVALFGGCIQAYRVVHLVVGGVRHLFVAAIHR